MFNFNGSNTYSKQEKGCYDKQEKKSNEKPSGETRTRFSYLVKRIKLVLDSKKEEKGQRIKDVEFLEYKEFIESHIYEWFQGSKDSIIIENNNKKLSTNLIMEILKLNGLDISRFIDDIKEYIINSPLIGSVVGEEKRFQDFKNKIFQRYPKIKNLPIEALQFGYGAQKNHYSYSLQKDIDKVLKYKFSGNVRNILEKLGFKYGYKKNQYKLILDSKEEEKEQRIGNIKDREFLEYKKYVNSHIIDWMRPLIKDSTGRKSLMEILKSNGLDISFFIDDIKAYIINSPLIGSVVGEEKRFQDFKNKIFHKYPKIKDLPIEALQFWYGARENGYFYYLDKDKDKVLKYKFPGNVRNILEKLGFKYGYKKNQ